MSANTVLSKIGSAYSPEGNGIPVPIASGEIFQQDGIAYQIWTQPAGTYILPDNGLPMFVRATGLATITSELGTVVAVLSAGEVKLFVPLTETTWGTVGGGNGYGYFDIPLNAFRETSSGNVGNAAANGGLLASDTTPILQGSGGGSSKGQRLNWAAGNVDDISASTAVPGDFDGTQDCYIELIGIGDVDDWDATTVVTNWNGGVNVTDATDSPAGGTTATVYSATVAAADIPDTPLSLSVTITPPAHAADALLLLGVRVRYVRT